MGRGLNLSKDDTKKFYSKYVKTRKEEKLKDIQLINKKATTGCLRYSKEIRKN